VSSSVELTPLGPGDWELFRELYADARLMRLVGYRKGSREIEADFDRVLSCSYHEWFVVRHGGEGVGLVGWRKPRGESDVREIGIVLRRELSGRGIPFMATQAMIERARADGIRLIRARFDGRNTPIARLVRRLGFRCRRPLSGDGKRQVWEYEP